MGIDQRLVVHESTEPNRKGVVSDSPLTGREIQVLQRVVLGEENKEIAHHLGCTPRTVAFHVSNILRKFGVASRLRLVARVAGHAEPGNPASRPESW